MTGKNGLRYHHLGVPTRDPRPGEEHLEALGVHVVPWDSNPFGIEWMRFEDRCAVPDLVRSTPHLAFEVEDLEAALAIRAAADDPSRSTLRVARRRAAVPRCQ